MKLLHRLTNKKPRSILHRKTAPSPIAKHNNKRVMEEDLTSALEEPSDRDTTSRSNYDSKVTRVQFNEEENKYYEPVVCHQSSQDVDEHDDENDNNIWYTKGDLQRFYDQTQDAARLIATRQAAWVANLTQAYQAFGRVESAHDMNLIFAAMTVDKDAVLSVHGVGLESWAVPVLKKARSDRRQYLLQQIHRLQVAKGVDKMSRSERAKRVRKVSHEVSRPGRLLAMHIAQRALLAESE